MQERMTTASLAHIHQLNPRNPDHLSSQIQRMPIACLELPAKIQEREGGRTLWETRTAKGEGGRQLTTAQFDASDVEELGIWLTCAPPQLNLTTNLGVK